MTEPDKDVRRAHMVEHQLRPRGIDDPRVLQALASVPRDLFVPPDSRDRAYGDHALGIGGGQTISQPYMVAVMTQSLRLEGHERVLEVGTGSGYQCAVLAELAAQVWSVERIQELAHDAGGRLAALGYGNVHIRVCDGTLGWPEEAPFDAILVTAAAPRVPPALLEQLDPDGGRLVAPVGTRDHQTLTHVERRGTVYETRRSMGCRFVPLVGEEGWSL